MNQLETSVKLEDLEGSNTIEDYFGYDIKKTLEEIEYNMEGLSFTIIMEPLEKKLSKRLKKIFHYKLPEEKDEEIEDTTEDKPVNRIKEEQRDDEKDRSPIEKEVKSGEKTPKASEEEETDTEDEDYQEDEDVLKLVKRIELRHKEYNELFNKVMEKLEELQEQYSEEEYKFSIIKRNKRHLFSDTLSEESSSDGENTDSDMFHCEEDSTKSSDSSIKIKPNSEDSEDDPDKKIKTESSITYPYLKSPDSNTVIIGPCGTEINRKEFDSLQWKDAAGATRELCNVVFGERILATHSLTGNQSPAFRGRERPIKTQLDSNKTSDITSFICNRFNVTQQLVRATITTKCADAAKKIKRGKSKKK